MCAISSLTSTFAISSPDEFLSVTGPTVWNSLSNTLREQSDEDSFKRQLKTFLFSRTLA